MALLSLRAVIASWAFVFIGCAAVSADEKPAELTVSVRKDGNWQLVTLDVSSEKPRVLIEEAYDLNFPTWSPDGRRLAFVCGKDGRPQIDAMDTDGGHRMALTNTTAAELHPRWSHDGKRLFVASTRTGNYDVWCLDADGGHPQNLTNMPTFDSDPAPSPDGKLVAFASNRGPNGSFGAFHIWVMRPDGSEPKRIVARNLVGWIYPSWSPDATQIVFSDRTDNGSWQIFSANIDGEAIEQLTEGTLSNAYASWSPDGRYIAYLNFDKPMDQSPESGRLMLYDTESLAHRRLGPDDMRCQGSWPAWRPTVE